MNRLKTFLVLSAVMAIGTSIVVVEPVEATPDHEVHQALPGSTWNDLRDEIQENAEPVHQQELLDHVLLVETTSSPEEFAALEQAVFAAEYHDEDGFDSTLYATLSSGLTYGIIQLSSASWDTYSYMKCFFGNPHDEQYGKSEEEKKLYEDKSAWYCVKCYNRRCVIKKRTSCKNKFLRSDQEPEDPEWDDDWKTEIWM